MKVVTALLAVSLLLGAVTSLPQEGEDTSIEVEAEISSHQTKTGHRLEIQVEAEAPSQTQTQTQLIIGQLPSAIGRTYASIHSDTRGEVSTVKGAAPEGSLNIQPKMRESFLDTKQKTQFPFNSGFDSRMLPYPMMVPSAREYQTQIVGRQQGSLVQGVYSLIQPPNPRGIFIAHPYDGFQTTTYNHPIPRQPVTTSESSVQTYTGLAPTSTSTDKNTDTNIIRSQRPTTTSVVQQQQSQQQQYNQLQKRPSLTFSTQTANSRINQQETQPRQYSQPQAQFTTDSARTTSTRQQSNTNQHQFTPDTARTTNVRQQLSTNQQHQFGIQHPLYAQLNTQQNQPFTIVAQHHLMPSSFQQAQNEVRPVILRQVNNMA